LQNFQKKNLNKDFKFQTGQTKVDWSRCLLRKEVFLKSDDLVVVVASAVVGVVN